MNLFLQKDGWLRGATHVLSQNQDARPQSGDVCLLVVHCISLPRGEFGGNAIVDILRGELNCDSHPDFAKLKDLRVSAHFLIRRNGELLQFVSCNKRAWHAGQSQWRGREQCNDFSVGAELEGADDIPYAAAQYETLTNLYRALAKKHAPLLVAGHEHISPGRKTDPGEMFDWKKLFCSIGEKNDGRS